MKESGAITNTVHWLRVEYTCAKRCRPSNPVYGRVASQSRGGGGRLLGSST